MLLQNTKTIQRDAYSEPCQTSKICITNVEYQKRILNLHKKPPRGVVRKICSENMQQIYRRTFMPKCDLNEVALQLY